MVFYYACQNCGERFLTASRQRTCQSCGGPLRTDTLLGHAPLP